MGLIKTLSLQLLPLRQCFQLPSSQPTRSTTKTIRLIASDGQVKVLKQPVLASVLMRQHPLHLICSSDSFFIGQKVPTLSTHDHLQPGHSYFILPAHFFHSVLSFVTLSSSLLISKNTNKSSLLCSFDVCRTEKGLLQVRLRNNAYCHDDGNDDDSNGSKKNKTLIVNSEVLEKEYRQLVGVGRWKPRLETIREKKSRRVGMLLNTRRRKKLGE